MIGIPQHKLSVLRYLANEIKPWSPPMPPLIFFTQCCLDFVGDELPKHSVFLLDFCFGISFENSV